MDNDKYSNYYEKISKIGGGAFGTVWLATHMLSKKKVAMKIVRKKKLKKNDVDTSYIDNELAIMAEASHPNLVNAFDLMEDDKSYCIVMENVMGGDM
jgi:serine/threonine protein kinase